MNVIVTVRLPRRKRQPIKTIVTGPEKVIGKCPVTGHLCTDITGEHHSFLATGPTVEAIRAEVGKTYDHITRIEEISITG